LNRLKTTGGEIILKYLEMEGVPYIIGIPGHGCLGLFDAIKKSQDNQSIKYIQVKHEQAAVHIADGYYRISGKPLAVFTSIGPGALNTAIGMGTAYVDSSAVLLLTGKYSCTYEGCGCLQEIERYQDSKLHRALEPLSKRSWRVESQPQRPRIMKRAFNMMLNGRSGPVTISLPMDVQSQEAEFSPNDRPSGRFGKPIGAPADIRSAVELMRDAKRPVILAGGGALRSKCAEELQELAELWGAAVVTTLAGKSAFPENHSCTLAHRIKGNARGDTVMREADVILGAWGPDFADETTLFDTNRVKALTSPTPS
jgi:acetolactate synthase-1/2/3 large subunit